MDLDESEGDMTGVAMRDSNGNEWILRLTIGAIKEFELRTGVQTFKHLFELWKKNRNQQADGMTMVLSIVADLFPGIEDAAAFVYACLQAPDGGKRKLSFDDFCESTSPLEITEAVMKLVEKLEQFVPEPDETKKRDEKKDGSRPLGR